jgi:hypothetical protein
VTPNHLQHYFSTFAFFPTSEDFLGCFKDQGVSSLYYTIGLHLVHRGEGYLGPYLMAKFLERVIVDCDFFWNTEAANDVLPKNLLIVAELILVTCFASIHLVKYSIAMMAKVKLP